MMGCCVGSHGNGAQPVVSRHPETSLDGKAAAERIMRMTVAILAESDNVKITSCAGVWVEKNLILTAAHCVDEEKKFYKYATIDDIDSDDTRYAIVLRADEGDDLALLFVDPDSVPEHPIAVLTPEAIAAGDSVDIVGHTAGYPWTFSRGCVSAVRENIRTASGSYVKKIAQISAPVWMGNSGGGAFDKNGYLVGLSSWISKSGPDLAFFIHKDVIEAFLIREFSKM